jgi:hypothetical protein
MRAWNLDRLLIGDQYDANRDSVNARTAKN